MNPFQIEVGRRSWIDGGDFPGRPFLGGALLLLTGTCAKAT